MAPQNTNAAQHAEPEQARINLSALNQLDTTVYEQDEDGAYMNRPNLNVYATLSHETEDYIRVVKVLRDIKPVLRRAEQYTHGETDGTVRYNNDIAPLINRLLDEIGRDMGAAMVERLTLWGEDYI